MHNQIDPRSLPLYDLHLSFDPSKHIELLDLMSINYSKLGVSEIMDICRKCNEKQMFTGVIYWYRNLINDKRYIGKTINPIDRHSTHLSSSKPHVHRKDANVPIHRAIKKYGIDKFEYRVLCFVVETTKQRLNATLNEKEKHYIALYRTTDRKYGYNILEGGNCSSNEGVKVRQYSKFGEYITTFNSIAEAERQIGGGDISQAIRHKTYYCNGYVFVPVGMDMPTHIFDKFKSRVIHQYSIEGKYLNTFDSPKEAAKAVGGDQGRISLCAKPPCQNIAYGFRWSRNQVSHLLSEAVKRPICVCQYDKDGFFVNEYDSLAMAAKAIDCKCTNHISICVRELWRKAGGYYWRTFKTDKIELPNEKTNQTV